MKGKELLLKALVQSRALFLATLNGMPESVQSQLERGMRSFLWGGKKGKISWGEVTKEKSKGGLVLGQHQNPTPWITCGLYKGTQRF